MKMKALSIGLVLMLVLCACTASSEPVQYTHPTGLRICMPEGFEVMEAEGFLGGYQNRDLVVTMVMAEELYESLANVGIDPDMTLEEYGQLVLDAYGIEGTGGTSAHGTPYIRYEREIEGVKAVYYAYLYRNDVAFWTITLMCAAEDAETMEEQFSLWASTVEIPAEAVTEPYTP